MAITDVPILSMLRAKLNWNQERQKVLAENVANSDTPNFRERDLVPPKFPEPGVITAQAVAPVRLATTEGAHIGGMGKVDTDKSDFRLKYEPGHPSADANGNVKYPNVNPLVEMTDMREAQRSYEANINVISATRRMLQRTLDILKA